MSSSGSTDLKRPPSPSGDGNAPPDAKRPEKAEEAKAESEQKRPLVLVTGGSRGIGKATCLLLASKGYDVIINYNTNRDAAQDVLHTIQGDRATYSGAAAIIQADVSDAGEVNRMFLDITRLEFDRKVPNGLVVNAGILGDPNKGVDTMDKSELDRIMATNVYGAFYCIQEFVKRASVKRGGTGGSIVNVSSGSAHIGRPLFYAMSKGALDSMMAGLAKSLPEDGIRINAVVPGMIATDMPSEDMIEKALPMIPMNRVGEPEEIASVVEFLLSDASSYCCGAKIRAAGGRP